MKIKGMFLISLLLLTSGWITLGKAQDEGNSDNNYLIEYVDDFDTNADNQLYYVVDNNESNEFETEGGKGGGGYGFGGYSLWGLTPGAKGAGYTPAPYIPTNGGDIPNGNGGGKGVGPIPSGYAIPVPFVTLIPSGGFYGGGGKKGH